MSYVCKLKVNIDGREFKLALNNMGNDGFEAAIHHIIDMCHGILSQVDAEHVPVKEKPVASDGFEAKAAAAAEEAIRTAGEANEWNCTGCKRSVFARSFPTGWKEDKEAGELKCNECQFVESRTSGAVAITCFECGERSYDVVDDVCADCRLQNAEDEEEG